MATRKKIIPVTNLQQVEDFAGKELTSTEEVEQVIEQMVAEQSANAKQSKPATKKPVSTQQTKKKQPKPTATKPASKQNPNRKTPVHQTPENFRSMVELAKAGKTIDEIATQFNCIPGLVRFVLQGKGRTQHTGLTPPGIWPEYQKMHQAKSKKTEEGKVGK